jgi:hypothetical protein
MHLILLLIHLIGHYHRLPVRPVHWPPHRPHRPLPPCAGAYVQACPIRFS